MADVSLMAVPSQPEDGTRCANCGAEVVPDQLRPDPGRPAEAAVPRYGVVRGSQRLTGEVNGLRAELIGFLAPAADGAHDCQFSLL